MDKYELRRRRLLTLINKLYEGKRSHFARAVGLSESYVARMLYPDDRAGKKRIGEEMVERIAKAVDVDPGWFELPYPDDGSGLQVADWELPDPIRPSQLMDFTKPRSGTVKVFHPDDPPDPDIVYVPESRIEFSAGNGSIHYELIEEEDPAAYRLSWFQKNYLKPTKVRRFRISGDSQEPLLFDGDIVLVNLDETNVVDGKLYAIRYGDELRVKYLSRRLDGTLVLRSMNPAYKDEEIPPHIAEEHISIIGRVRDRSGNGGL